MALTFGFYNSLSNDRKYSAKQFSSLFDGIINDGIFRSVGNRLNIIEGSGMQVLVRSGRAWFNGTWTLNDADLPLSIAASESLDRIDIVVLEVNENVGVRANSIKIIKGISATTPSAPALTNTAEVHQYALAHVHVTKNITEITPGLITNKIGTLETPYVSLVASIDDIGDRIYSQNYYVESGESLTDSVDQLDLALRAEKIYLEGQIALKATTTNVYTKAEANSLLGVKANSADVYTKSAMDTLLAAKQAMLTGAATSIAASNLSINRALISDGSGKVAVSSTTSEQIGFLSDVTSALQAQLNGKLGTSGTAANSSKVGGRTIYHSATEPAGAVDGDIWFKPVS
jgi:hypothetical protein